MNMISTGSFLTGTDATKEQDTLAGKFAAVWEKKNAKAARAGGVSLMALTLAACGSSSDDTAADTSTGAATTETEAETETTTTASLTALQAQAADLLTTIAASDVAVEAATIAAGATATVMDLNDATTAPITAAAATTAFDATAAAVVGRIVTNNDLEGSDGLGLYDALASTLATMLAADEAVTTAATTALAASDAALADAFAFEAASDANALNVATVAFIAGGGSGGSAAGTVDTAAETAGLAGLVGIGAHLGANAASVLIDGDTIVATQAELDAGIEAYTAALHASMLANSAEYTTAVGNLTAGDTALLLDAMEAIVGARGSITVDANSGLITADSDVGATLLAVQAEVEQLAAGNASGASTDLSAAGQTTLGTITFALNALTDEVFVTVNGAAGAAASETTMNIIDEASDQAYDAAIIAAYQELAATIDLVSAADAPSVVAGVEAGNVGTISLGAQNIDIDGGAATAGDDVFIFNEANGNMTIGTAATAAAPGNVLGGAGADSVIIFGEYASTQFVTIGTAAEQAAIGTTAVGDAGVLEIFVYQDATTGNAVLSIEENAFDGSTTSGQAMTTLTLTDVTFADLTQVLGDGVTVLNAAEVVA